MIDAHEHWAAPLAWLVDDLRSERDMSRTRTGRLCCPGLRSSMTPAGAGYRFLPCCAGH